MVKRVNQHPDPDRVLRHHEQPERAQYPGHGPVGHDNPDDPEEPSHLVIPSATLNYAIVVASRRPMASRRYDGPAL